MYWSHDLDETLTRFRTALDRVFGVRLRSLMLYGSTVYNDLAPGYGDLDFLAVVTDDLTDREVDDLVALRRTLRSGSFGILDHMLEGAFLPVDMLDPEVTGRAFWWGTRGEREWRRNELGALDLHIIRERGIIIAGEDIRSRIPPSTYGQLLDDARAFCASSHGHGRGGSLHSIDWLLTAARMLLWLRENRLSSKSEAASWGVEHARGSWRFQLSRACALRLDPSRADEMDTRLWLAGLDDAIRAACDEVEREIGDRRRSRRRMAVSRRKFGFSRYDNRHMGGYLSRVRRGVWRNLRCVG